MENALIILAGALTIIAAGSCLVRPNNAMIAVLLFYPIEQLLQGYYTSLILRYYWVTNLALAVVVVAAATMNLLQGRRPSAGWYNRTTLVVFILYAWVLVTGAWTPAHNSILFFLGQSWPYYFLFFVFGPMLLSRLDDVYKILFPFLIAGIFIAVLILVNPKAGMHNDRFTIDLGYLPMFGELQSNPLALANFGGALIMVAALYRPERRGFINLGVQLVAGALGLVLALLSGSRGQVVFAIALVGVFVPMLYTVRSRSSYFMMLLGGALCLGLVYFAYSSLSQVSQQRWTTEELGMGFRDRAVLQLTLLDAWSRAPQAWVIGLGASAFNAFYVFRPENTPHWYPHNVFAEALFEYGIIGFGLFITTIVLTWRAARELWNNTAHDVRNRSGAAVLFSLTAFELLLTMKQGYMLAPPMLFMMMITVSKIARREADELAASAQWGYDPEPVPAEEEGGEPEYAWGVTE